MKHVRLVLILLVIKKFYFLGALTLASVLLYPKTLGGGAVFSGWVPFNSSILERVTPEAKKVISSFTYGHFLKYSFISISDFMLQLDA